MEDAQKESVRTQLPITDNMLAALATYMLLKSNSFPRNRPPYLGRQNSWGPTLVRLEVIF